MGSSSRTLRFDRFELPGGIRLAVHPTRKLKTVLVKAYLTGNLDEAVTRKALIPMVLRRGSSRFPDMQAMQRHLEDLYGASLAGEVMKAGEWHTLKFRLECVNGRFLPGDHDVLTDALRFFREMVFEPCLADGAFRPDYVEQEKQNLQRIIESLVDNKDQYALERLIRVMCADEPFRRYEYGDAVDLPSIDPQNLTAEWLDSTRSYPLDLYVCGDVDVKATRDLLESIFAVDRDGGFQPAAPPPPVEIDEPSYVTETLAVNQGKLCLGFRHGTTYVDGDLEAAVMANGILGSFSHSKLFQNVREKASLAYDAHSALEKTKGLLFVVCGIAVENYQRALDIVLDQVRALQEGEISEEEMLATRESFDNHLQMLEDSFHHLVEVDYLWRLHGRTFNLGEYRERLRQVTPERVVEMARQLKLDTVFFLRN